MKKRTEKVETFQDLQDGDTLTVTLTYRENPVSPAAKPSWVTNHGYVIRADSTTGTRLRRDGEVSREVVEIDFAVGDVVVSWMSYAPNVTFVRGPRFWQGSTGNTASDAAIREKFKSGRARLIARDGVALVPAITRESAEDLAPAPATVTRIRPFSPYTIHPTVPPPF